MHAASKPEPGQPAPPIELPSADGQMLRLEDLRGKWVVLYFYPKDNTSGCTREAHEFSSRRDEFDQAAATVVGISPDSADSHRKFIAKHGLTHQLATDATHAVLRRYGAWGRKSMYGKQFEGVIRSTVLIDPEGRVAFSWPKVKVAGHAQAVLDKLTELVKAYGSVR
mgnify:CR=1 FL=1